MPTTDIAKCNGAQTIFGANSEEEIWCIIECFRRFNCRDDMKIIEARMVNGVFWITVIQLFDIFLRDGFTEREQDEFAYRDAGRLLITSTYLLNASAPLKKDIEDAEDYKIEFQLMEDFIATRARLRANRGESNNEQTREKDRNSTLLNQALDDYLNSLGANRKTRKENF